MIRMVCGCSLVFQSSADSTVLLALAWKFWM